MTYNKPEHIKDEIWSQHLRWLELINRECESNRLKRRDKKRFESGRQHPE